MHHAAFQRSSVFESDYERFCADLRAALKGRIAPNDEHFLKDGSEGRHRLVTVQRVMWLASQSPRPEHREMLSEIVRPLSARQACVQAAFEHETSSNGDANLAQMQYAHAPCKSTWALCRETLMRQLATTRASLDALASLRSWQ